MRESDQIEACPGRGAACNAAPQSRDRCIAINERRPRLSSAALHDALRPGHGETLLRRLAMRPRQPQQRVVVHVWIGVKSRCAIYSGRVGVRM